MADRAKREKKAKLDKLAELKRAREGGGRSWVQEEDTNLYDEVSEEQYKRIVKGRLAKDDFVVDDGIDGYNDNGMDDWDEQNEAVDSDQDDYRSAKSKKKPAKDEKPRGKPKVPPPAVVPASITSYRPAKTAEQESDFMDMLLGDMNTIKTAPSNPYRSRKRKPSPPPKYRSNEHRSSSPVDAYDNAYSDGFHEDPGPSGDEFMSPKKKQRTDPTIKPALDGLTNLDVRSNGPEGAGMDDYDFGDSSLDEIDPSAFDQLDEIKPAASKVNLKVEPTEVDLKKPLEPLPVPALTEKKKAENLGWMSYYDSLSVVKDEGLGSGPSNFSSTTQDRISALEPDGSLRFFWLDYLEHEGKVHLIGKLKDKNSGVWISCCITVENLQRNLYVLPRERRIEIDEDGDEYETDIVPQITDVYQEFDTFRKRAGVKTWKAKFVQRKYAFGERDVPRREAQWMKVVYGFDEPPMDSESSGKTFSRVLGTNTSAFELLVLKRKIMGPCWLQIKKPQAENRGISWCKFEVTVLDPKDINPFPETDPDAPRDMPPLTVMSLSVRIVVNHKENKREVVCATARIWSNIRIDDSTPPESLPCSVHTFVRPLDRFPPNFEPKAKANSKGFISPVRNEQSLLNCLLVTIQKSDPDVIVGHEFLGVSLDVLLGRMKDLKADHWSRIGRFRRTKMNLGRPGTNLRLLYGRLVGDLASDGAKGMISSTTWSLTEMCKTHLNAERQDIDPEETAGYFDGSVSSPDRLLNFVKHCELDAHYQMAIASRVQILPLTKQLTNLAGNAWNKTLNGGRAERNEYILLHEFHRLKYICPDKTWGKKTAPRIIKEDLDEDGEGGGGGGKGKGKGGKPKRDKYKGGLVFEPKRGLWDRYVLVMDFNSLYPSIIQEYNIDFTTVSPIEDEEDMAGEGKIPEPPSEDVDQGILPRLIATLVSRRRQVKSLMKDKTATQQKLLQWDIKQMALKLTANSMYGCLGFEYSRFYARPLAALTTHKGREILTHTRELAESLGLDVVYGDTDSIFVNTNATVLSDALRISYELKKAVNDRYKLLEIDLDGIFQRLLLLQKKKYAAVKVNEGSKTTSIEIKGLDMKRREYSALSKTVSQYVLDQILSGEMTEIVVENIHEYLRSVGENIRAGRMKQDDFIIFKRLGKNPEDYPDAKSQPHVQVALRMKSKGGTARAGDVISYIFCLGSGGESSKTGQADRARHPDEVRKADKDCQIDYDYYLSQQILPPIERLCERIEGTDRSRLAECLGLDPARFRSYSTAEGEELNITTLDSQIPESERYNDADPLKIRCRHCKTETDFVPIHDRQKSLLLPSGPTCPTCRKVLGNASIQVQLERQIREHIAKYYLGWTVCDDSTCGNRTRMMSVYGKRCLRPGCTGRVTFEYSDTQLYNQLRYYAYLFDGEAALRCSRGAEHEDQVRAVTGKHAEFLSGLNRTVKRFLDESARRWVNMQSLFSFTKVS